MLKKLLLTGALALWPFSAWAIPTNIAIVVATCGTLSVPFLAGRDAPLTVDTTGQLCKTSSGGGSGTVTSLTPGSANIVLTPDPITTTGTIDLAANITVTTVNKLTLTPPASAATLTLIDGTTITGPSATTTLPGLSLANVFTAQQTAQGLTTTAPGWYAQITGDAFPRIRVGLDAADVASIAFGSGAGARDLFLERAGAANVRHGAPDVDTAPVAQFESMQNALAGGTSNVAGADYTLMLSKGKGTGAGGRGIIQGSQAGSTGTAVNALTTIASFNNTDSALLLTPAVNTNALAVTGYSLTGTDTHTLLDLAGTWNVGTTVETALKLNVTDTASGVASLFADFQIGGVSKTKIDKGGLLTIGNGAKSSGGRGINFLNTNGTLANAGIYIDNGANIILDFTNGGVRFSNGGVFSMPSNGSASWTSGSNDPTATIDLALARDAANTLALRNGANTQKFRTYGTFTDSSNGDWLEQSKAAGGAAYIRTVANGTGTASTLSLGTGGTNYWTVGTAGGLTAVTDNSYDIGASGANRARTEYLGTSLFSPIISTLTGLTLTAGAYGLTKMTASASAPGAAGAKLELVCGTNGGTAKLVAYAGTSATATTIIDNIGAGVTGC